MNTGDIVGLISDHCTKANTAIKGATWILGFPSMCKSYVYSMLYSIVCNSSMSKKSMYLFFFLTQGHIFIVLLEKEGEVEREKERNIDGKEKHQLVASLMCPDWGLNPQPRHVPWPGLKPMTFQFIGQCPNQLSHTSQGKVIS